MDIGHLPVARDVPGLNRVEVIDRAERTVEAAQRDELPEGGLHVTGLVDAPALKHRVLAIPGPGKPEARVADREHRPLQRRLPPSLAAVDRHVDARHHTSPGPREPADLVEAGTVELHLAGWEGDDGLRFHLEGELHRLAVGP